MKSVYIHKNKSERDDNINALVYAMTHMNFEKQKKTFNKWLALVYLTVLIIISIFFMSCAPVKNGVTSCGEPNQYQCVNLCDGLFIKRKGNWDRYFANELDCNIERNPVYEEYR